ncbi:MAG: YcxB family protein [Gluconacetobacter diazotrophicus]|nr:YcxB family protein [Gluconacetobacter diazotrophicus]
MTDQPPAFEFTYTRPYIAEMLRRFGRAGRLPWLGTAVRVAVPLACIVLTAWMIHAHWGHLARSHTLGNLLPVALGALACGLYPQWMCLVMYQRVRKLPMYRTPIRVELTPQGLSTTTAVGHTQLAWAAFPKARQFPDGFLLLHGPRAAFWLPLRALVAGESADAAALLGAHVADFQRA